MRPCFAVLLLSLAACDLPDVDETTQPISVDPNCGFGSLKIYPQDNYAGTPICLIGYGEYTFPRGFDPHSYHAGFYEGCFKTLLTEIDFEPGTSDPNAPSGVVSSGSVGTWNDVPGGIDGPFACM